MMTFQLLDFPTALSNYMQARMKFHELLLNIFRAMVAMLSRKSGLFYTDFGYDYSCLVIRNGVIIFATKQDYPNYKGKLLPPPYHPIHQKISHFNLAWMFIKISSFDSFKIDL